MAAGHAATGPRTRLVRNVPATRRDGDRRMVPLVPLIPASAVSERLYPLRTARPVLDAVQDLLREQAPDLLEAHWTLRDGTGSSRCPPGCRTCSTWSP